MTLRHRLLTGMAVIAAVLAVAAVFITRTTEDHLVDQIDAQLRRAEIPRRPGGNRPVPGADERPSSLYVAIADAHGDIATVYAPNLGGPLPLPSITAHHAITNADDGPFTVGSEHDDLRYRAISRQYPRGLTVVYALPLGDVDDAIQRLVVVEIVATIAVLAVLGLVVWWVIHLGVRPIKRMTETAAAIAGGDLTRRVPDVRTGTEAGELGAALNRMLEVRLRSEERLRQFVGDASHELRTPITTIRGYAELYRAGALDDRAELDEAMRRTEEESVRMGTLVDDLLHLARLDQGRPLEREPVDVGALARDAVRDAQAVDPGRVITVDAATTATVTGDEGRLRQVLANLVTNALVHTQLGTPVAVLVAGEDGWITVEVRDEGPGMDAAVAGRAFERFYRADPSRSRHRGGSGLGLAIVDATVAAHGGSVAIDTAPGEGTTVRVRLPASS